MLKLKPVEAIDEQRLFEWRNLPEIIERGFRSRAVSKEEHANWFAAVSYTHLTLPTNREV